MTWWEIPQNCNCFFALDANTRITGNTTKLSLSNTENNWLVVDGLTPNRVSNSISVGFESENFENKGDVIKSYKSLYINDINLNFNKRISTGRTNTWILKCLVRGNTVFAQGFGSSSNPYGPTFDMFGSSESYGKCWYVNELYTGSYTSISNYNRRLNSKSILTLIIKNDFENNKFIFKTDYNEGEITPPASYFQREFGSDHELARIGHESSTWFPKAEIIAFGMFDKILSEEEEVAIFQSIDQEFLIKSQDVDFNFAFDSSLIFNSEFKDSLGRYKKFNPIRKIKYSKNINNSDLSQSLVFSNKTLKNKFVVKQVLYKNLKSIEDTVLKEGIPAEGVKLFLYERFTGTLIKTTTSSDLGKFSFNFLSKDLEYVITANDANYQFKSIIKNYDVL